MLDLREGRGNAVGLYPTPPCSCLRVGPGTMPEEPCRSVFWVYFPSKGLFGWNRLIVQDRTARFSFSPEGMAFGGSALQNLLSGHEGR